MGKVLYNPFKLFIYLNIFILFLYVLKLSNLYVFNFQFLLYYSSSILMFWVISYKYKNSEKIYYENVNKILVIKNPSLYMIITILLFLIGIIANLIQYKYYGFPIFLENKINRDPGNHYLQYLVNFLMMTSCLSYIGFRQFNRLKRYLMLLVLFFSIISLIVWLNRGAFTLLLLCIVFYEYSISVKKNSIFRFFIISIIMISFFILFFGYIGNLRSEYVFENIYKYSINKHFGVSENIPPSLVQLYMYLTSPLENASRMIFNQPVNKYYYGIMLFYPYLAPILKYFSLVPISSFYPPLWDNVGLNVSTYITDAYQDFGFFGMYIYLFLLFLFLRTGQKTLLNGVYGLLCYISVVNIAFWMVFDNAFRSGPFLISFFLFYFISIFDSKYRIIL